MKLYLVKYNKKSFTYNDDDSENEECWAFKFEDRHNGLCYCYIDSGGYDHANILDVVEEHEVSKEFVLELIDKQNYNEYTKKLSLKRLESAI